MNKSDLFNKVLEMSKKAKEEYEILNGKLMAVRDELAFYPDDIKLILKESNLSNDAYLKLGERNGYIAILSLLNEVD